MLQAVLGVPQLQVVYWSLAFELIFYLLVTLVVIARLNNYSAVLTAYLIGATLIIEVLCPVLGGPHVPLNLCGFLLIMFSGVLLQRAANGRIHLGVALGLALAGLAVNTAAAIVDSLLRAGGWWQNLYLISAWGAAYTVFIGAYALRDSRLLALPPLRFVGRISYSIYLLHLPIILVIPPIGGPLTSILIWSAATLGLATITFSVIEQPMIKRAREGGQSARRLSVRRRSA
jgi:peptidoglycan/LPS O-acetylase OafA/YrhL